MSSHRSPKETLDKLMRYMDNIPLAYSTTVKLMTMLWKNKYQKPFYIRVLFERFADKNSSYSITTGDNLIEYKEIKSQIFYVTPNPGEKLKKFDQKQAIKDLLQYLSKKFHALVVGYTILEVVDELVDANNIKQINFDIPK